jgi:hypothetical protein
MLSGVTEGVTVGFGVCVDVTVTSIGVQNSEKGVVVFPVAPMTAIKYDPPGPSYPAEEAVT